MYGQYHPQCLPDRRPLLMWIILTGGALFLVALIVAAPVAKVGQQGFLAAVLYEVFSHLCHQQPERSFYLGGNPLAVCARCTGLYVGFAAAVLLYPLLTSIRRTVTPDRKWLFIALAPLAIDFGLEFVGIWNNTHSSRFFTGALLGAVAVFYIVPALTELSQRLGSRSASTTRQSVGTTQAIDRIADAPSDYSAPLRRI